MRTGPHGRQDRERHLLALPHLSGIIDDDVATLAHVSVVDHGTVASCFFANWTRQDTLASSDDSRAPILAELKFFLRVGLQSERRARLPGLVAINLSSHILQLPQAAAWDFSHDRLNWRTRGLR